MCGIAGIVSFNQQVENGSLYSMITKLHHRGPDGEGMWINENKMVGLAHKRLSIIDLADTGKQPMHYANERYTITFNGEIYNYIELKEKLRHQGYTFHSTSDTEVLLALYDLKKEAALGELDGMFAFSIWDSKENILFCARDRFGEKPFYYHVNDSYFAFASEMKALFELTISKKVSQKKIYNYILYGILEDPLDKSATFYEAVKQLEPAHYMIVTPDKRLIRKRYWDLEQGNPLMLSEQEAVHRFRDLFTTSVERRLRSDVPVGSSLSGGLDSSSIVMLIDKIKKEKSVQKTFSARFLNFSRDEGNYMQLVIDKATVEPHFVFPTVDSVIDNLKTISYHQEEPIASASVAIQFEVMKLARQNGIKVLLDGQGADEMLAGYTLFWTTYLNQLYASDKIKFKSATTAYTELHNRIPVKNNLEFKWRAIHNSSFKTVSQLKNAFKSPSSSYFLGMHPDLVSHFRRETNPIPKPVSLKEHLYFFLMKRGINELLRYADRNAMAHGVEVRLPFLNHQLVEFLFQLPDEMLLNKGWSKYILRKSMEDLLPPEITWRKDKIGYEPPQDEWLATPHFKDYLNEAISYLKKEKIISMVVPELTWHYIALYAFTERNELGS